MSSYTTRKTPGDTEWFVNDRFGMFIHFGLYSMAARHEWIKSYECITEEKDYAWFSIKDNGIGISKENLSKIFDRFYRVENATHTVKGTGLGLHLVKMTIEQYHHGKITVESTENIGSTFTVYLPLNIDESELA